MAHPHFITTTDALMYWTDRLRMAIKARQPDDIVNALHMIASEGEAHLWELSGSPTKGQAQRWTTKR